MAEPDRLKQQVVRQAVRENLDVIRGLPPRGLRPGRSLGGGVLRALGVAGGLAVGLLAFTAMPGQAPERPAPPPRPAVAHFPAPAAPQALTQPLSVRRLVLDPGHGGSDSGARAEAIWEKDVTLDVARRLRTFLERATYEVVMTRDADVAVPLRQRAQLANTERADLFVSIHVNSVPERDCHAVETYYLGPADDSRAEQLAGIENRESGYSLADFRRLLEGVYVNVRQTESRQLAQAVQQELVSVLGTANPAIRDKGVRSAPFLVLVATESPGILAEVSCLSNEDEARLLAQPEYRQKIARALFVGIHAYADGHNRVARRAMRAGSR